LLDAHDDSNNASVSHQASDYLKETCPLDRRAVARAGLSRLLGVCGGKDSHIAFQQSFCVREETCPWYH
jgi:hypothetical protein